MGHEFITELAEERFADTARKKVLAVAGAQRLEGGDQRGHHDFLLAEVRQGLADCSSRTVPGRSCGGAQRMPQGVDGSDGCRADGGANSAHIQLRRLREVPSGDRGSREPECRALGRVLRDLSLRGMSPPRLAIAKGAGGLREAWDKEFPETRLQLCWIHKERNIHSHMSQCTEKPTAPLPPSRISSGASATAAPRRPKPAR